jgi:hypothetical protein
MIAHGEYGDPDRASDGMCERSVLQEFHFGDPSA